MSQAPLGLRLAPALAGGRLRDFNRALWLLHQATAQGREAWVILDEACEGEGDRDLWLLDAQGNPCRLPGPETGRFSEHGRAALLAAARDRMPGTGEAEPALDRLLPRPGDSPLEAALELWQQLLAGVPGVRVIAAAALEQEVECLDPTDGPEIVWIGPRHQQAMRELGVPVEVVLAGEAALKDELAQRQSGEVPRRAKQLESELDAGLAGLREAITEESPGLLGSWNRYRRAARKAMAEFRRARDRFERNRKGIRGNRLHALAQGLRPHDQAQEDFLGLVCAMALFRLEPEQAAVEHREVFHDPIPQRPALVFLGAGISAP